MVRPEARELAIERLKAGALDVLIPGGGIDGAGIARDLAPPLACLHPTSKVRFQHVSLPQAKPERIAFAVRHEMPQRLADPMFVSTYWGFEQQWKRESLEPYAREMGRPPGWDQRRVEQEIE